MNKYRILIDSGTEWPISMRQIHSCIVCMHAVLAEQDAYWIAGEGDSSLSSMKLACSEECANMFILQNMDEKRFHGYSGV